MVDFIFIINGGLLGFIVLSAPLDYVIPQVLALVNSEC